MSETSPILFFDSAAGIWAHSATAALMLNRLAKQGARIITVSCDGYFEGLCSVRQSRKRSLQQLSMRPKLDCSDCQFTSNLNSLAARTNKSQRFKLGRFISPSDRLEVESYISSWSSGGFPIDYPFRDIPLPRMAGYEVSLKYKSWELATAGDGQAEYVQAVKDVAITFLAASKLFSQEASFSAVIVGSPQYASNRAFAHAAASNGLRVIAFDQSANIAEDQSHLSLWEWDKHDNANPAIKYFEEGSSALDETSIERVDRHLAALRKGTSHKAYSPPKVGSISALRSVGARVGKPTALLALSSMDEMVSAQNAGLSGYSSYPGNVFNDQFEWVRESVEWFKNRPEFQAIIRIHPREFPNKREAISSPAGLRWERELAKLPPNVLVNHPKDEISIYSLFEEIEVVVTGWSSVGLEACLAGLQLVTYDKTLPDYPANIGLTGDSKLEYFENLQLALAGTANIPNRERALAWMHHSMNRGTSRVGGRFLASRRNFLPRWISLLFEGVERYLYFISRPLDLLRGIVFESSDGKFFRIVLKGKKNFFD